MFTVTRLATFQMIQALQTDSLDRHYVSLDLLFFGVVR